MSFPITNEQQGSKLYYGLHMLPGCAEYQEGGDPYRIFINEATIRKMDASFQGKPVFVRHKNEVDIKDVTKADGVVVRSFYNSFDGKHWAEFMVFTDSGHEAIRSGWKLSNAYIPKEFSAGGLWNGITYEKEVLNGDYEHLAIVPDPRYAESVIMTPDQFKAYNESKSIELKRLQNSKGEESVLKLFKRTKVENSADFDGVMVQLPLSKKELTLNELVEAHDKVLNMQGYASDDHMVKVNDSEEMTVKGLRDCYNDMKKKNEESELDGGEKEALTDKAASDKTENADEKKEEKKEEMKEEKKENSQDHFSKLKNAPFQVADPTTVDLNKMARGKSRYGSED